MKIFDVLSEGPNDPHIFKAIFLAGGPGSGKSFVSSKLLGGTGLRVVNSDDIYEYLMKKQGMALDPETIFSPAGQETREKAKAITKRKQQSHIDGRLGLIIDGTGKDVPKYAKTKKMLEDLGYETMMLFVNTSLDVAQERNLMRPRKLDTKVVEKMWNAVQQNIMAFQQLFGAASFYVVDNSGGLEDPSRKDNFTKVQKAISRFINTPSKRREARAWLDAQKPGAKQTNESTSDEFDIDEVLEQIADLMDDIDSDSISNNDPEYAKMLERDYRALHAVENVLKNNKLANARGNKDNIFHYDIDPDSERYGAIHVKIVGDTAEIVWLGSYNSSGKKLYNDVKPQLKSQGVKKVKLTTKWESEGFYTKLGFSQDSDTVSNPIAGSSNTSMSMKLENSAAPAREITQADLNKLEQYVDKVFGTLGIDVNFTRHFLDRVNDERNVRQITLPELALLFRDEYTKWGKKIAKLGPDAEAVMKDMRSDINIPFALNWDPRNQELDLIAKTVMRKKNFKSPDPAFPVESVNEAEVTIDADLVQKIEQSINRGRKKPRPGKTWPGRVESVKKTNWPGILYVKGRDWITRIEEWSYDIANDRPRGLVLGEKQILKLGPNHKYLVAKESDYSLALYVIANGKPKKLAGGLREPDAYWLTDKEESPYKVEWYGNDIGHYLKNVTESQEPNQLRGKDRAKTTKPSTTGSQPHPFKGKLVGNS